MEQVYAIASELGAELGDPLGPAQPLGGKPGRDYRVRLTSGEYVVRLPRSDASLLGSGRESERLANEMAASLGIAPAVAGAGPGWLVIRFLDRRPVDPRRLREEPASVAAALRSFHESGLQLPDRLVVPELLERCARQVRECGAALPDGYALAHALTARIAEALPTTDPVPSHNNLVPSSVLDLGPSDGMGQPRIALVDWEYAAMGDPLFDLASLAVHCHFDEVAQRRLLVAYFGAEPDESRVAALQLMRLMVQAYEAARALAERVASGEDFEPLLRVAEEPRVTDWMRSVAV